LLYIENSLNLNSLLDNFICTLKKPEIWNNPFEAPLAIFSDIKVEQWFKLQWIKNCGNRVDSAVENVPVLMNLNTDRLESFIFSAIAGGVGNNEKEKVWYERLNEEILRDALIQKLISEADASNGKKYYQTLNSETVNSYIENRDKNGNFVSINEIRLFNFAKITASLFVNYLNSRNDNLENGIFNFWINNPDRNFFDVKDTSDKTEEWQHKLFNDLFKDGTFKIRNDESKFSIEYVTLPQLININKASNNGELSFKTVSKKIFIFGFSGMGQSYIEILKQLSKSKDVDLHIYIQANDVSFNKAKNPLLKKWNNAGSENLSLWKPEFDEKQNKSGYTVDSMLSEIQYSIDMNAKCDEKIQNRLGDGTFTVTSAPTMLREIEAVHSSICKKIKESKENKEPVSYSDFIVLSPDIQQYRVPVMQVFEQIDKDANNEFPYIPYVFSDFTAEYSAISEAINILVSMLEKKSLCRKDLFLLLRNSIIKYVKDYSEEQLSAWSEWTTKLNGYRDRINHLNEWKKIAKRIMLSQLTENVYQNPNDNEIYKPYSNVNTEDFDSVYKFIEVIDSLEKWISDFSDKSELQESDIDAVSDFIFSWFKFKKQIPSELSGEKLVLAGIRSEINNYKMLFKFGTEKVNAKGFFISLCESAKAAKGSSLTLFTGGITFGNFSLNRTIPAKYVYILGLDSKSFPGIVTEQVLDLRTKTERKTGDDTIQSRNKEAFLCQLMAAGKELHLSYVNKDLKKDADFFRSSVIDDIFEFIKKKEQKNIDFETAITIDEKREWSDLFTQRGFRNKKNYNSLVSAAGDDSQNQNLLGRNENFPDRVRFSSVKMFLTNPFVYNAKLMFAEMEDDEAETETTDYEPIKLDNLERAVYTKDIVINILSNGNSNRDTEIQKYIDSLIFEGNVSDGIYGDYIAKELKSGINAILDNVENCQDFDISKFEFNKNETLSINQTINNKTVNWNLSGTLNAYYCEQTGNCNVIKILDFVAGSEIKNRHVMSSYVTSLFVAANSESNIPVEVEIYLMGKAASKKYKFLLCPNDYSDAVEMLKLIYRRMFYRKLNKFISIEMYNKDISGWADFIKNLEKCDDWNFFTKNRLFDPFKHFGYKNPGKEVSVAEKMMKKLVKVNFE